RFQDDGNVSRILQHIGRPELQRQMRTVFWQLLPKETDGAGQHRDLSRQPSSSKQ
ncbi:hypothetical protein TNCV_5022931, partial [Trichonephila clavipes]